MKRPVNLLLTYLVCYLTALFSFWISILFALWIEGNPQGDVTKFMQPLGQSFLYSTVWIFILVSLFSFIITLPYELIILQNIKKNYPWRHASIGGVLALTTLFAPAILSNISNPAWFKELAKPYILIFAIPTFSAGFLSHLFLAFKRQGNHSITHLQSQNQISDYQS